MSIEQDVPLPVKLALENATHLMFDVDGTLTERQKPLSPELAQTLARIDKTLGIATSRAIDELDEIFQGTNFTRSDLIKGPVVIEDGSLVVYPGEKDPTIQVAEIQAQAIHEMVAYIKKHLSEEPIVDQMWHKLDQIDFPLVHVPSYYSYQASGSIWQQVIGTPRELDRIMDWCQAAASTLAINHLIQLTEIGDGTLRISVPGFSKGTALGHLHERADLDLSRTVFFGDGRNDLPAAHKIREKGGMVVAVDKRCRELTDLANYVCPGTGPTALQKILICSGIVNR